MERFPFDFALPLSLPLRFLGVNPGTARVDVHDEHLEVVFGPWRLATSLGNVEDATVTGPYNPLKAYGVRVSLSDLGATFGTTTAQGLCISFREPVAAVVPGGLLRHPSVTVTVAEPDRLRRLLLRRAHDPRPLLAAVEADDVPAVPVQEPAEEKAARDRTVRRARQAARTRAQHREEQRREEERAARKRSAVAKRAAATRAENRAQAAKAEQVEQIAKAERAEAAAARTPAQRTPRKRTAARRTPAKRTASASS